MSKLPVPIETLADAPWLTLLLPELTAVTALRTMAPDVSAEQQHRLLFTAVAGYLRRIADRAGTLLVLDGLQWAGCSGLTDPPPHRPGRPTYPAHRRLSG